MSCTVNRRDQLLREQTPPSGRASRNVGPPRLNFASDGLDVDPLSFEFWTVVEASEVVPAEYFANS
jgi:hypothetical protein